MTDAERDALIAQRLAEPKRARNEAGEAENDGLADFIKGVEGSKSASPSRVQWSKFQPPGASDR